MQKGGDARFDALETGGGERLCMGGEGLPRGVRRGGGDVAFFICACSAGWGNFGANDVENVAPARGGLTSGREISGAGGSVVI